MTNEIKEKDIIQNSLECLSNAKFNDTTYEVARDIVLDYITNLQKERDNLKTALDESTEIVREYKEENERVKDTMAKIKDLNTMKYLRDDIFKNYLSEILKGEDK